MNKKLQSIFESQDSIYKAEYLSIVNFYKQNKLKYIPISEYKNNFELYTEVHHINPRYYFKSNRLEIDNSENNTVRVPFKIHIKLHLLLVDHYKFIDDKINLKLASHACNRLDFNRVFKELKNGMTEDMYNELLSERIKIRKIMSEFSHFKKYTKQYVNDIFDDYVKFGFDYIIKKYDKCPKKKQKLYALFDRNGISYQKEYKINKKEYFSKYEVKRMCMTFNLYDYQEVVIKYTKIFNRRIPSRENLIRLFKKFNMVYVKKNTIHKRKIFSKEHIIKIYNIVKINGYKFLYSSMDKDEIPSNLSRLFRKYNLPPLRKNNKKKNYTQIEVIQLFNLYKKGNHSFKYIKNNTSIDIKHMSSIISLLKRHKLI